MPTPEPVRFILIPRSGENRNPISLGPGPLSMGRSTENKLVVADAQASKKHASIEPFGEGFRLVDLGSRNGTFVNGKQVQKAVLQPDDVIRIGAIEFAVRVEMPAEMTIAPEMDMQPDMTIAPGELLDDDDDGDIPAAPVSETYRGPASPPAPVAAEPVAPPPPPAPALPPPPPVVAKPAPPPPPPPAPVVEKPAPPAAPPPPPVVEKPAPAPVAAKAAEEAEPKTMRVPAPAAAAAAPPAPARPAPEAEPSTMKVPPPAAALDVGGSEKGNEALKALAGGLAASLADGSTRRVAPEEIAAALAAARAGKKEPAAAEDLSKTSVVSGPSAAIPAKPAAPAAPATPAAPAAAAAKPAAAAPAAGAAGAAKPAVPAAAAAAKPAAAAPAAKGPAKSPEEQMLRSIAIFAEASSKPMGDLLKSLADEGKDERAEFRVFAPGSMVCREGEYTADFFVVLSGLAGVFMSDRLEKGKRKYLASLGSGRWFGEMSCMSNAPRSATVVAESDLVVLSVPRHIFMLFYEDRTNKKFRTIVDEEYRKRALANHLGSVALFRSVEDAVLRMVSSVAELVVVEKGATVVAEGTPGDAMYLVRTGHAKVVRKAGGQDEILAWLRENSFFGEASLLRNAPRNSSVVAVDRMDLVKLPSKGFLELLASFPAVKEGILEQARRITEQETLTPEEEGARRRAREIGTEHEVIKAGAALVIDLSKCTRCNMCVEGCVEAHDDHVPRIGKRGLQYGDLLLTSSCYNCKVPDCMLACGFGALRRDRNGQVRVDNDACVGCGMCEPACPYGTIHMQSRVGDEGISTKASAGPVTGILRSLPLVGRLFAPKPAAAAEAPAEAAATAAGGAAPAAPAKAGGNVGKAMAVKCDLCAGRSDMACIASCPCGAIERIDPSVLLGSR